MEHNHPHHSAPHIGKHPNPRWSDSDDSYATTDSFVSRIAGDVEGMTGGSVIFENAAANDASYSIEISLRKNGGTTPSSTIAIYTGDILANDVKQQLILDPCSYIDIQLKSKSAGNSATVTTEFAAK